MKTKLSIISLLLFAIIAVGCGKTQTPVSTATQVVEQSQNEFAGAPEWVLNNSLEGVAISAVGSAPISAAGLSLARTEALADARNELARSINVKVDSMIKRFVQQTGVGNDATVEKVVTDVSKQLTSQFISGSVNKGTWVSKNNNLFVLVVIDPSMDNQIIKAATSAVTTTYQNDKALWQQFQAKNAQDDLESFIAEEFNKPNKKEKLTEEVSTEIVEG